MEVFTCNSSHYWYTENNLSIGFTQQLPPSHCLWMQVDFVLHGKRSTSFSPCTAAGRGAGSKGIPSLVCASSYHDPGLDQVHCIFTDCNRALFLCQKMSSGPTALVIFWILFFFSVLWLMSPAVFSVAQDFLLLNDKSKQLCQLWIYAVALASWSCASKALKYILLK